VSSRAAMVRDGADATRLLTMRAGNDVSPYTHTSS
jgi:hypothetical protein